MNTDIIASLERMPYAQAKVVSNGNGDHILVSYQTPVAFLSRDGWLYINGLYSATTRKHIRAFVRQFIPYEMDFSTIRAMVENRLVLNIHTGEVSEEVGKYVLM